MIIWNWLIAKAFSEYKDSNTILIFASWVSNSQNKDLNEFKREIDLIKKILQENTQKLFVYISSCSIDDETLQHSLYVQHKINAENIIKASWNKYLIIRTSNPIWFTKNPNTLLNFLCNKILSWEHFTIWENAKRNLIDVEDLFKIWQEIINKQIFINKIINIANTHYFSVLEIVNEFEKQIWKKWNYEIQNIWWYPKIDTGKIESIISNLNINFESNYLEKLIKKYYPLNNN